MTQSATKNNTRTLTLMAMLAAMAYVAMLVTRPLPRIAGFLSYDLKDVVLVVSGFILGPLPALLITAVVSLLEMVTVGSTGFIGFAMNVLASGAFVLPAAILYNNNRRLRSAALGLALGTLLMTALMLAWNFILTPLYMHVPRDVVAGMLLPTFLPFNLVKGGLNAGVAMLVYKPLSGALRRARLLPERPTSAGTHKVNLPAALVSAFVVITCVLILYFMAKG